MAVALAHVWNLYEATYYPRLAPKTREIYRGARKHAERLPARPTAADVERWRAELADRYSTAYTNQLLAILQTAVKRGTLLAGGDAELVAAVVAIPALRVDCLAPRCPPADFRDRAITVAKNPAERAWLRLAGEAGLRRGELEGLRPEAIDPERLVVNVVRQRLYEKRKNRRPHAVEIDAELAADLRWTIDHRAAITPRTGWHKGRSDGFIFPWGRKYQELFLERVRAVFGDARDKYLPRGLGWHAWRHAGASALAEQGASEIDIAEWLGDADTKMAARYVARLRGATRSRLTGHRLPCKRVEQVGTPRAGTRGVPSPTFTTKGMALAVEWVTGKG